MPQKCKVCAHPDTREMEEQYVEGKPKTQIARTHGVPTQSVDYHMDNHLPEKLVRTVQKKEQAHAADILSGINDLLQRTKGILSEAEGKGQNRLALDAIKEARSTYELLSKIAVKLEEYRRKDEEKESNVLEEYIENGLKVLSDAELTALIQLMGKVHASKPDHELDQSSRYIVEAMGILESETSVSSQSDSSRNSSKQVRNSSEIGLGASESETEFEDLDEFDLDLDDLDFDNTIPSEKNDPDWLRRDRNRYR